MEESLRFHNTVYPIYFENEKIVEVLKIQKLEKKKIHITITTILSKFKSKVFINT